MAEFRTFKQWINNMDAEDMTEFLVEGKSCVNYYNDIFKDCDGDFDDSICRECIYKFLTEESS